MKSIITLITAIFAISGSFASNENHKGNKLAFYKSEDTVIFNPSTVLANHVLSMEERIIEDGKIIGVEPGNDLKAAVKSAEEIIFDDQQITEALIPAVAPLDMKIVNEKPASKFAKCNMIIVKN